MIKQKIKKLFFYFILFNLFIFQVLALSFTSISGVDVNPSLDKDDTWVLNSTSYVDNTIVKLYNQYSSEYINEKKRVAIYYTGSIASSGSGLLTSSQYGSFYTLDTGLFLIKSDLKDYRCDAGSSIESWAFSGQLNNPGWGVNFNILDSYYCPSLLKWGILLEDSFGKIGKIELTSEGIDPITIIAVENVRGLTKEINTVDLFDSGRVGVSGIIDIDEDSQIDNWNLDDDFYKEISNKVVGKLAELNKNIGKNIIKITKGLNPNTEDGIVEPDLLSLDSENIYYYNFEGLNGVNSINGNNGKILRLGNGGIVSDYSKLNVSGEKVIILEGGNLYIDTDIYNQNNNSLLTIIVKRDLLNNKNGGNIYIDPYVTNLDVVLISEGSILNYDRDYNSTETLNVLGNSNRLGRQLLIYGMIATRNTIGNEIDAYGSDGYINNGKGSLSGKYDLNNLRSFQVTHSTNIIGIECNIAGNYTAMGINGNEFKKYAFAGKKECYIDDDVIIGLRGTDKVEPLVIEYNSNIQKLNPFILRHN